MQGDTTWNIVPGAGIGPIRFGASLDDVARVLGTAAPAVTKDASATFLDGGLVVKLADDQVAEIVVTPRAAREIAFGGRSFFDDEPDLVLFALETANGGAIEAKGDVVFAQLGIRTAGLKTGDPADRAVTLLPEPFDATGVAGRPVSFAP